MIEYSTVNYCAYVVNDTLMKCQRERRIFLRKIPNFRWKLFGFF